MFFRPYSFIFLAIIFWSINPVASKIALEEILVPKLASMREVFSFKVCYRYSPKKTSWGPFLLGLLDPGLTSLFYLTIL